MSWKASALAKDICKFPSGEPLNPSEKCVLLLLGEYCHPESGVAYPAVATLAAKACMTTRNCSKILARLAENKVIEVIPRRDQRGLSLPNLYRLSEGGYPVATDTPTPVSGDRATLSVATDKPTYTTDNRTDIEKKDPSDLVESPDSTPSLGLFPEDVKKKKKTTAEIAAARIREYLFPYFCDATEHNPKTYTLTDSKLKKGVSRLMECLKKTGDDGPAAEQMFAHAIQALADDDWNMGRSPRSGGKKNNDWIDHLCESEDIFEKRLARWSEDAA